MLCLMLSSCLRLSPALLSPQGGGLCAPAPLQWGSAPLARLAGAVVALSARDPAFALQVSGVHLSSALHPEIWASTQHDAAA